jgi:glycosyltransferase involved in cell wall biosynthesis
MKIAHIIDSFYPGGAEKLLITFAEAALLKGYHPTFISLGRTLDTPIWNGLRNLGVQTIQFTGRNLFDLSRFLKLMNFLRAEQFDILHAHLGRSIILGGVASKFSGTPIVCSLHNIVSEDWGSLEAMMLRWRADRVIAVGPAVARAYRTILPGMMIEVVPNPVKTHAALPSSERLSLRTEIALDAGRPIIMSVGRLNIQKGFHDLIDAMYEVHQRFPRAFLGIVGGGGLQLELWEHVQRLQLQDHVRLLGIREDVPALLAASDIYVCSSHWEGMPISVLEAMAAGLPVIATDVGDIPELISPETGILLKPHQPAQLAEHICTLLGDSEKQKRLGDSARTFIHESKDPGVWVDRLLGIYGEVLEGGSVSAPQVKTTK